MPFPEIKLVPHGLIELLFFLYEVKKISFKARKFAKVEDGVEIHIRRVV